MGTKLDLKLIDETYGTAADLYEDVLRVPTTATQDEIQLAYFDRRSELFTLLAKIDAAARDPRNDNAASLASVDQKRYVAEKKMDSVVFAVRILADPALRQAYNAIRPDRTGIATQSDRYTLQNTSAANGNASINRSFSHASESSSSKISSRSSRSKRSTDENTPRVVTPTEGPIEITHSASTSDSRNWIQSAFSSSLFGSISHSKTEDDDEKDDGDRHSPRKSKRRLKKEQSASSENQNREADPVQDVHPENSGEKENKPIWGRKKRKKKKRNKDENGRILLNNSMDTSATTDTSMTDHEEANLRNKNKLRSIENSRPSLSMMSSTSNGVNYLESPHEAVSRGSRAFSEDDNTQRDDDTRTFLGDDGETFATGSLLSSQDLDERAQCADSAFCGCLSGSRVFKKIANEVSGACEDTMVSVDQVFNAFTLTDKDIKAVKKKIDKAQRQLAN